MMHILPPSTLRAYAQRLLVGAFVGPKRAQRYARPTRREFLMLCECLGTRVRPRFPRLTPGMHPRRRRGSSPSATIAAPTRAHLPPSLVDPDRGRGSATVTWYCPCVYPPIRSFACRRTLFQILRGPVRNRSCSRRRGLRTATAGGRMKGRGRVVDQRYDVLPPLDITCCVGEPVVGTCGSRRSPTASLISDTARANARRSFRRC
ncbi:uncharacterized protein SCHCODRAFT_02045449 [Schizophyllum commune H4-8]|uniref:uncharacterized protein n=1 Tax=Schizophyllum commune (strain H4-8 / FGSC 9210) TaxID=578458 RepID=UPI00215E5092|nr:uncharacterized protein SCHCODRAFT_02045449 [Schizophyllum commune H4-8]KAI5900867.1 hypothetical protein SCHCODRAFT_02045449 [Schizophyllum commune H4-8]